MIVDERTRKYRLMQKRLYYERKSWGVCVHCGKRLKYEQSTSICEYCSERNKARYAANKEIINAKHKQFRDAHIAAGLCVCCNRPALEGSRKCAYHKEYYKVMAREAQRRKREANKTNEHKATEVQ